jgi:putative two-component system response regulator
MDELLDIAIVLVEDNIDDVDIVRRMLRKYERARFKITHAGTGGEALTAIHLDTDVALVDHGLPDMTGVDLVRTLRNNVPSVPVIMLTGQGDAQIAVEAMRAGAYDYFPKDVMTSEVLGHAIHQTVARARAERELLDEQLTGADQIIFALASAAEVKDSSTERHLQRMARYAVRLGEHLHLNERQLLLLRQGALLHDIGKIGVSEAVLAKPGALLPEEWTEMRRHPLIGERICAPLKMAADLRPIVRHHHEKWDGSGYVDGLAGEQIPYLARVISVVDAFDAMTTDRIYRRAYPLGEVLTRLRDGSGSQFDPAITSAFVALLEREGFGFVLSDQSASQIAA